MEPSAQPTKANPSNRVQKLMIWMAAIVVLAVVFRDFVWAAIQALMLNVLPILFTPVILELTVGFAGLLIVAIFCHIRRKDHENEWVYIAQVEPEAEMEEIPEPLRRRVGEAVLRSKPEESETSALALDAVEGMIELGMLDEAEQQLKNGSEADQGSIGFMKLRLQVWLRREDWKQANDYATGKPSAAADELAITCVEVASNFVRQKPARKDAATECLNLGKSLSVSAVMQAIDADGKLQRLA